MVKSGPCILTVGNPWKYCSSSILPLHFGQLRLGIGIHSLTISALHIYRLRTIIHTSEKPDTLTRFRWALWYAQRKLYIRVDHRSLFAKIASSEMSERTLSSVLLRKNHWTWWHLGRSPGFLCPDSFLFPSLDKLLMNRRRNTPDYLLCQLQRQMSHP